VKVRGEAIQASSTSSIVAPLPGSTIVPCINRCERCGVSFGARPFANRKSFSAISGASVPLIRITPIPPSPGGVAIAAMVPESSMVELCVVSCEL